MEQKQNIASCDGDKAARFLAGSSALLAASLTSGVLSFAWTVLMSRLLGPEGYGIAGPFLNAFWMLSAALSIGIPHAMATYISDCHHVDPEAAKRVMAQGTRLLFTIGISFAILAGAGVAAAGALHKMSPLFLALSWLMLVSLLWRQVYLGVFAVMGGVQRMGVLAICNAAFPITMLASSVLFVIAARRYYPGNKDAYVIAGAGGIAAASIVQYAASLVAVKFAGIAPAVMFAWRGAGGGARKLLSFGLPAAIAMIACSNLSFIPPVVVSFLAHHFGCFGATPAINAASAGWFSNGFTYALAPMLIVGMVFAIVPAASEAESQGNHALMQRYFDLAVKYCLTIMFFVLSVYTVFAGRIVQLFSGDKFPHKIMGPMTGALAVGICLCMLVMLMCNILIGLKRPKTPAFAAVVMLVCEVAALTAAGLFRHTIFAAALAFDAAVFLGFLFLVYYLHSKIKLRWAWSAMFRPAIAGAATAFIIRLLPAGGAKILIGVAASIPCYFGILTLIGGVNKAEFDMMMGKKPGDNAA